LAGGTALALQIGHRTSIDFDFYAEKKFDPDKLYANLKNKFKKFLFYKKLKEPSLLKLTKQ
jgi:hypothetical protein